MYDLVLYKQNEAFIKFDCEKSVAQELADYFTFFVPGYQFTPAFRNRLWDGKIRLFDLRSNSIYLGLIPYLRKFCEERQYDLEFDETGADLTDDYPVYHGEKFVADLKLQSAGKDIETVRKIRDEIKSRVESLLTELI